MPQKITCPECMNEIELDPSRKYAVGDIIECPYCGSELEVVEVTDKGIEIQLIEEEK